MNFLNELGPKYLLFFVFTFLIASCSTQRKTISTTMGNHDLTTAESKKNTSEPISKRDARKLRRLYRKDKIALHTTNRNDKGKKLQRFRFDSSSIQEILTKNASGRTPDRLVLYLGLRKLPSGHNKWYMIAVGMENRELLDMSADKKRPPSIFVSAIDNIRIPREEAEELEKNYRNPKDIITSLNSKDELMELHGFAFYPDHIQKILTENTGKSTTSDHVIFYLGAKQKEKGLEWHLIAYGMKNRRLLKRGGKHPDKAAKAPQASIYDKADPCPPCY